MRRFARLPARLLCLVLGTALAAPALADVEVRIQSRPPDEPIKAFLTVTDDNGQPVGQLDAGDFEASIDGSLNGNFALSLPPFLDPSQHLSVIFAIDYSSSVQLFFDEDIQAGITVFVNNMTPGDRAGIVKFNDTQGANVVQPFVEIDGGANTTLFLQSLADPYDGVGTNLLDALDVAANEFADKAQLLPPGPKAVILITDGDDNSSVLSQSDVVEKLHAQGIAVFTVSVGDISEDVAAVALMTSLAQETGGAYFEAPGPEEIDAAYATITALLNNSYILTWPADTLTDCTPHMLEVTVMVDGAPQVASIEFVRCDKTPDDFHFADATGVEPGEFAVSNTVTITGIDTPTEISVTGGEYSIGCTNNFTSAPGLIDFEDEVCVRHTAASGFNASAGPTVLVVGGVSSSFSSTTHSPPPSRGGGGGGGATGVLELLLGLAALLARRRLAA